MNKKFFSLTFTFFCLAGSSVFCLNPITKDIPKGNHASIPTSQDLEKLDNLIEASQTLIENQKALRNKVQEYEKLHAQYLIYPQNNELLYKMVKTAYAISEIIKENHLEHVFSPEFLGEINVLSQVAAKRGIPAP